MPPVGLQQQSKFPEIDIQAKSRYLLAPTELELALRTVGRYLGRLQLLKCAKAVSIRINACPTWNSSPENCCAELPKIDVPGELSYLPTHKELERALWNIDSTLGPLQSLKCTAFHSLWKISYTICNRHPKMRKHNFSNKIKTENMQDNNATQDALVSPNNFPKERGIKIL